jgi:hypothetical protein
LKEARPFIIHVRSIEIWNPKACGIELWFELCRDRIGLRARRKKFKFSRILGNEKASRGPDGIEREERIEEAREEGGWFERIYICQFCFLEKD